MKRDEYQVLGEESEEVNLEALGLERMQDARELEARERLELLRKKRYVDLKVATELRSRGWTQASALDGLLWCSVCGGPTIWKNETSKPMHHTCLEL